MPNSQNTPNPTQFHPETAWSISRATISWPAIFAGLFVTVIVYVGLMCLGLGVGGRSLYDVIQNQDEIQNLGIGAALWTVISAVIALYAGGHVSGRVAGLISTRVGRIQGLVIASVFFALMFTQVGMLLGALGGGITSAVTSAGSAASRSNVGQQMVEDALGDLRVDGAVLAEVTRGVAARLLRGDTESAINFLANRAGIPPEEARERIDAFQARFRETATQAGLAAANALRSAGWTLFISILLGALAGMVGGGIAANYNLRQPVSTADNKAMRESYAH